MTAIDAITATLQNDPQLREQIAIMVRVAIKPEIKPGAFYTYEEAATLLGLHNLTITRAVKSGHLHADYIGADPRIRGRSINQWLREGGKTGRSKRNLIEEQERAARKGRRA
jgi:excisionase family DNA binding protein